MSSDTAPVSSVRRKAHGVSLLFWLCATPAAGLLLAIPLFALSLIAAIGRSLLRGYWDPASLLDVTRLLAGWVPAWLPSGTLKPWLAQPESWSGLHHLLEQTSLHLGAAILAGASYLSYLAVCACLMALRPQ